MEKFILSAVWSKQHCIGRAVIQRGTTDVNAIAGRVIIVITDSSTEKCVRVIGQSDRRSQRSLSLARCIQ